MRDHGTSLFVPADGQELQFHLPVLGRQVGLLTAHVQPLSGTMLQ
jgi:hypothetical protein